MNKRILVFIISFTFCFFSSISYAGIKSKVALLIGTKVLISAAKNPQLQAKVITSIKNNPELKQKAIKKLQDIIANPKHANINQSSKDFLAKIENIPVPKNITSIKPPATGPPGIPTIGVRLPLNSKFAGQVHPSGVPFTKQGFPDFSKFSLKDVNITLTGNRTKDFALANKKAGFKTTPKGYTWHHHENGKTMQLVPTKIHNEVRHTGGQEIFNNGGKFD